MEETGRFQAFEANGNQSVPIDWMPSKHYCCDGPDKDAKHEPKKEKTLGKPKPKIILENNWPVIFKSVKVIKINQRWRQFITDEWRLERGRVEPVTLDWILLL